MFTVYNKNNIYIKQSENNLPIKEFFFLEDYQKNFKC